MKPLLIVRPEPGAAATLAAAQALGIDAKAVPLFAIGPVEWDVANEAFDAILVGSANAFRHGGPLLAGLRHLPVHAVGQITADAARAAGFTVAQVGQGGLQAVLDATPAGAILRLAGAERVPLLPPPGVTLTERVVYWAEPLPLPEASTEDLRQPAIIALHSAAAARHFASECDRSGIDRAGLSLVCIGPRVAEAAGVGWGEVRAASRPADPALLALAAQMCQTGDHA